MKFDAKFGRDQSPFFLFDAAEDPLPGDTTPESLEAEIRARLGFAYYPHLGHAQFLRVYVDEEPAETRHAIVAESSGHLRDFRAASGELACGQLRAHGTIEHRQVPKIPSGDYKISAMDIDLELMGRKYIAEEMMSRADYRAYRFAGNAVGTLASVAFISFLIALTGTFAAETPARGWTITGISGAICLACVFGLLNLKKMKFYQRGEAAFEALVTRTPSVIVMLNSAAEQNQPGWREALIHRPSYERYFPDQTD